MLCAPWPVRTVPLAAAAIAGIASAAVAAAASVCPCIFPLAVGALLYSASQIYRAIQG